MQLPEYVNIGSETYRAQYVPNEWIMGGVVLLLVDETKAVRATMALDNISEVTVEKITELARSIKLE